MGRGARVGGALGGMVALGAAYGVVDAMRARREAAAAGLERFPVGLNFTLTNPDAPRARTLRYLALGDSTVQGDGASRPTTTLPYRIAEDLRAHYACVELRNIGVSGATSGDVLRAQVPQLAGFAPDLVTLSIGANDVTQGRSRAEYLAHIARILAAVDALPGARAVVLNVPALDTAPVLGPLLRVLIRLQSRRFNAALPPVVARHRAVLVDVNGGARAAFARDRRLYARDGFHPSDAGYALWAALAAPAVAQAVADL